MPRPQPIGHLQFAVIGIGMLTVVLTILLIISPGSVWWALGFPRELAMYRVENAHDYFEFGGCPYAPAWSWQLLHDQPNAAELFDSVAANAETAAGVVMAEAGRRVAGLESPITGLESRVNPTDSLQFLWQWDSTQMVPLAAALESPFMDSVLALLQRPLPDFEC
jgi:hypothetical protein